MKSDTGSGIGVGLAPSGAPPAHAPVGSRSLDDVHSTVNIPRGTSWWRRMWAFAGPAYLVSVGYMDPGNWATDIEGGARFGYALIWVLLMSNLMAVLLQTLATRLGIVTGRDLAQACRDSYGTTTRWALFVLCEIAIAACDLAEVLGTAIGINLLSAQLFPSHPIPLIWAVVITATDVLLLMLINRWGIRRMEAFIIGLVGIIGACFVVELFLSKPSAAGIARGFVPTRMSGEMLVVAIGIIGATVMPHNLYLHSALVQSRRFPHTPDGVRQAMRFNFYDSVIALNGAFFVNAAILAVAAATFFRHGIVVTEIQQAYQMLEGLLGTKVAPTAFAVALICSGQSSTITGTLAGQITMEGFLHFRMRPWLRRLITRTLAIVPAVIVIAVSGNAGTFKLLILSQVILSLQLPFAVVPLVKFTGSRAKMGELANAPWLAAVAWVVAGIIVALNAKMLVEQVGEWADAAGQYRGLVLVGSTALTAALAGLLLYMTVRPDQEYAQVTGFPMAGDTPLLPDETLADAVADVATVRSRFARIGVALEATAGDAAPLAEAVALAQANRADLILLHVVEGVGGQFYGNEAGDAEVRQDEKYVSDLSARLQRDLVAGAGAGAAATAGTLPSVRAVLGYGNVIRELVRLAADEKLDLLVVGGHGHRGLADVLRGETIAQVRHGVKIPVLAVRGKR